MNSNTLGLFSSVFRHGPDMAITRKKNLSRRTGSSNLQYPTNSYNPRRTSTYQYALRNGRGGFDESSSRVPSPPVQNILPKHYSENGYVIWNEDGKGQVLSLFSWRNTRIHLYFDERTELADDLQNRGGFDAVRAGDEVEVDFEIPPRLNDELASSGIHVLVHVTRLAGGGGRSDAPRRTTATHHMVVLFSKQNLIYLLTATGEKVVFHPQMLVHSSIRTAILNGRNGRVNIGSDEQLALWEISRRGRTVEATVAVAPRWTSDSSNKGRVSQCHWATSLRLLGQDQSGIAVVVERLTHFAVLLPIDGSISMTEPQKIFLPLVILDNHSAVEPQSIGHYSACQELPGRSHKWRAFRFDVIEDASTRWPELNIRELVERHSEESLGTLIDLDSRGDPPPAPSFSTIMNDLSNLDFGGGFFQDQRQDEEEEPERNEIIAVPLDPVTEAPETLSRKLFAKRIQGESDLLGCAPSEISAPPPPRLCSLLPQKPPTFAYADDKMEIVMEKIRRRSAIEALVREEEAARRESALQRTLMDVFRKTAPVPIPDSDVTEEDEEKRLEQKLREREKKQREEAKEKRRIDEERKVHNNLASIGITFAKPDEDNLADILGFSNKTKVSSEGTVRKGPKYPGGWWFRRSRPRPPPTPPIGDVDDDERVERADGQTEGETRQAEENVGTSTGEAVDLLLDVSPVCASPSIHRVLDELRDLF